MPHLDRFAASELASESEPLGDFSEEQGARLSAERAMLKRDRAEGRGAGRGLRLPGALQAASDEGAPAAFPATAALTPPRPQTTCRRAAAAAAAPRTAWRRASWTRRRTRRVRCALRGASASAARAGGP